jgi:hypothetical protein
MHYQHMFDENSMRLNLIKLRNDFGLEKKANYNLGCVWYGSGFSLKKKFH